MSLEDKLDKAACSHEGELHYQSFMSQQDKAAYDGVANAYCLCSATNCEYFVSHKNQDLCSYSMKK